MKSSLSITSLILMCLLSISVNAQNDDAIIRDQLKMIGKYDGEKVLLRWFPTTPTGWTLGSNYGYSISRMELADTLSKLKESIVIEDTLKAADVIEIGNRYKQNQNRYLAIAGELLHGDHKALSSSDKDMSPFQKAEAYGNMHDMAMLTAELNAEAGNLMALRYEDLEIEKNKTYAYQLISHNPYEDIWVDTTYVIVRTDKVDLIPTPKITKVYWGDRVIKVTWSKEAHETVFTAYHIERSEDEGKSFKRITEEPYIYSNTIEEDYDFVYYDSIPQNERPYMYRLVGINSYAEESKASEGVLVFGKDKVAPKPAVKLKAEFIEKEGMKISWEVNSVDDDIRGFMISKSEFQDKEYINITPDGLPAKTRSFVDKTFNRFKSNYYFVGTIDEAGNTSISMPLYAEYLDSIPPSPVTEIKGTIDTNGYVVLTWDKPVENDVKGYFVHFANQEDHVFCSLNGHAIQETIFKDTINVKQVLTEEIFYKIVTVDYNMNRSEYSEMFVLKKPDLNPPLAPLFKDYKVNNDHILLEWVMSSSLDIEDHILERKIDDKSGVWNQIEFFKKSDERYGTYQDNSVEPGVKYVYRLTAVDDDGLQTKSPNNLQIKFTGSKILKARSIENIQYNKESKAVQIMWSKDSSFDIVTIYRSKNKGPLRVLETVYSEQGDFFDIQVVNGDNYEYAIKIKDSNSGKSSKIGPKLNWVMK